MTSELERDYLENYYQQEIARAKQEAEGYDPVRNNYRLRSFVSSTKGRGRKRKQKIDVELVVDLNTGRAQVLKDIATGTLDIIAQGLLGDLVAPGEDPFVEFVRRLRLS